MVKNHSATALYQRAVAEWFYFLYDVCKIVIAVVSYCRQSLKGAPAAARVLTSQGVVFMVTVSLNIVVRQLSPKKQFSKTPSFQHDFEASMNPAPIVRFRPHVCYHRCFWLPST